MTISKNHSTQEASAELLCVEDKKATIQKNVLITKV